MSFQIPRRISEWIKTLVAGVISGSANAIIAAIGVPVAAAAGVPVKPLDWQQIGAVAISGGFIAAVTYLQKSPLPPDKTNGTDFFTKKPDIPKSQNPS
jgi:hypothetical protein